jgi:hypothetical protein
MTNETVLLFSYGTLQSATVQLETFGRELVGYKDKLLNYRLAMFMQRSLWINFYSLHLTYAQAGVPDAIVPNTR